MAIRKWTKIYLIFVAALVMAGVGFGFARSTYKRVRAKRLMADARYFMSKQDHKNAAICAYGAWTLRPQDAVICAANADALEATGAPGALIWRMRAAQYDTNNVEYRLAWARTALQMRDPRAAGLALGGVEGAATNGAVYQKLRGALAWALGDPPEAERRYREALRLEPTNSATSLNIATIHLSSTDEAVRQTGRAALEGVPKDSPLRANALQSLIAEAEARRLPARAALFYRELVGRPEATPFDQLAYLQALRAAGHAGRTNVLAGLQQEARRSPERAFLLGTWLARTEGPQPALDWLLTLPGDILASPPVAQAVAECQVALKDWTGLLKTAGGQHWGEQNALRFGLQSLARRELGQKTEAKEAWRRARLESSEKLPGLARLAQAAGAWGWTAERTELLGAICQGFPKERWALEQLIAELHAAGNTAGLREALSGACERHTGDARLKNRLAAVCLLQKTDLLKAHRLADEAYRQARNDPFHAVIFAYSLLVREKPAEAAEVANAIQSEHLQIPAVAAYYGVIQAAVGKADLAKPALERALSGKLLPEEAELVRAAQASRQAAGAGRLTASHTPASVEGAERDKRAE